MPHHTLASELGYCTAPRETSVVITFVAAKYLHISIYLYCTSTE
jgi:hypothetical protein